MSNIIEIGVINKAQGIKGELKVLPYTNDLSRFKGLVGKDITIKDKLCKVLDVRIDARFAYLKLQGVEDRNIAETYVGNGIFVSRDEAVELPEGSYFIVDLVGSKVMLGDSELGILKEVLQYGAADIYVVTMSNKDTVMFPALKTVLTKVDIDNKLIVLDAKVFEEIAVYED